MATIALIDPTIMPVATTFLFVFATVFALLSYSRIFTHKDQHGTPTEKPPTKVYALLAIVFGAFAAAYEPLVVSLQRYIPIVAGILAIVFIFVFIKSILRRKEEQGTGTTFPIALSVAILLVLLMSFSDQLKPYLPADFGMDNLLWIIGIIIVLIFFWSVYKYTGTATATSAPAPRPRQT